MKQIYLYCFNKIVFISLILLLNQQDYFQLK